MAEKKRKTKIGNHDLKELEKRVQIIDKIDDKEFGFAVKNNLIKLWELTAWQEWKMKK